MAGLAVQNFVSAATGIAVVIALARGLTRRSGQSIGNFWADLVRSTLYILLPLSLVIAVVLVQQGVPQTFEPYRTVKTLEPYKVTVPKLDAAGQPVKDAQGQCGDRRADRDRAGHPARPGRVADLRSSSSARMAAASTA
jgi:K+-transporting ATPase ATPase A chain